MTRDPNNGSTDSSVVDSDLSIFKTHHDCDGGDEISATIVDSVSAILGIEPTAIDPLYDVVDPDALDRLLASFRTNSPPPGNRASVEFVFNGCRTRVESNGDIWFELLDGRDPDKTVDF